LVAGACAERLCRRYEVAHSMPATWRGAWNVKEAALAAMMCLGKSEAHRHQKTGSLRASVLRGTSTVRIAADDQGCDPGHMFLGFGLRVLPGEVRLPLFRRNSIPEELGVEGHDGQGRRVWTPVGCQACADLHCERNQNRKQPCPT